MRYKIYSEAVIGGFETRRLETIIQGDEKVLEVECHLLYKKFYDNHELRFLDIIVQEDKQGA